MDPRDGVHGAAGRRRPRTATGRGGSRALASRGRRGRGHAQTAVRVDQPRVDPAVGAVDLHRVGRHVDTGAHGLDQSVAEHHRARGDDPTRRGHHGGPAQDVDPRGLDRNGRRRAEKDRQQTQAHPGHA